MPTPEPGWMHLNNGGINRPSLLSGSDPNNSGAAASGRILADIEGRAPQGKGRGTGASGKGASRRWIIIAVIGVVVVIAALLGFGWNSHDETPDLYSRTPASASPLPGNDAPAAARTGAADGAAMIVDAGGGSEASGAQAAVADGQPTTEGTPSLDAADAAAAPAPAATRTASARAQPRRQATQKQKQATDEDLLGTLLGIIKDDRKEVPQHESMDSLIAKIRADDQRNAASTTAAFDSIDRTKASPGASTGSEIQAQLRRCPSANTLGGIDCRRRICAAHAGKDPACPAR